MRERREYKCDGCGAIGVGAYHHTSWWSYPPGWFVMSTDETSGCVCSQECAGKFDDEEVKQQVAREAVSK